MKDANGDRVRKEWTQEAHRFELELEREIAEVEAYEAIVTNKRYNMYED